MVMKVGNFQYYHCLWFESANGIPLRISVPSGWDPKKPLNNNFYKHLHKLMDKEYNGGLVGGRGSTGSGGSGDGIRCYELFAVYLKFLPLKVVEQHSQVLAGLLLGRDTKKT